jgi:hypothetical protein
MTRVLFEMVNQTAVSQWLQASRWGLAGIEMLHLLGLAAFGGAVVLRNLGMFREELRGWYRVGLAVTLGTGVGLVFAEPMKCYEHPAFQLKMAFLLAAVVGQAWVEKRGGRWAGVVALGMWTGVGVMGRAIGFY